MFRWVCASIGYPEGFLKTAIVRFKYPAYGFMIFRQDAGHPRSDATIFGELANMVGTRAILQAFLFLNGLHPKIHFLSYLPSIMRMTTTRTQDSLTFQFCSIIFSRTGITLWVAAQP